MRMSALARTDQKFRSRERVDAVEAQAGRGGVELQVEGCRLGGLLRRRVQAGEGGGEGVGDAELGHLLIVLTFRNDLRGALDELNNAVTEPTTL